MSKFAKNILCRILVDGKSEQSDILTNNIVHIQLKNVQFLIIFEKIKIKQPFLNNYS